MVLQLSLHCQSPPHFFVQKRPEDLEREWGHLMWELYLLKSKGVSFEEAYHMTSEERKWWFEKMEEENERMKRQAKGVREL